MSTHPPCADCGHELERHNGQPEWSCLDCRCWGWTAPTAGDQRLTSPTGKCACGRPVTGERRLCGPCAAVRG